MQQAVLEGMRGAYAQASRPECKGMHSRCLADACSMLVDATEMLVPAETCLSMPRTDGRTYVRTYSPLDLSLTFRIAREKVKAVLLGSGWSVRGVARSARRQDGGVA
ncbi:hypothetical protein SEA_HOLLIDAY_90 [Gordonia phage Holliday]|nr:hypothetical protein SEA_HOLLIDAY_90 [Gordonia phage Holliday]